jgi:hypothetical protein
VSKRKNPVASLVSSDFHEDPQQKKLSEMHGALHSLGDKIRKPYPNSGDKLLPKELVPAESDDSKMARKHIDNLHAAMKGCKE